jgi:hypothetical protein
MLRDHDAASVSEHVVRILMSVVDYVNRNI